MKRIDLSNISEGFVAESDLVNKKGQLLIAKGTVINSNLLSMLRKKNIFELYCTMESDTLDDLNMENDALDYLNKEFESLLEMDTGVKAVNDESSYNLPAIVASQQDLTWQDIEIANKEVIKLPSNKPEGNPVNKKAALVLPPDRTEQYKQEILKEYKSSLLQLTGFLDAIASGTQINPKGIQQIVEKYLWLYIDDRDLLMCLSSLDDTDDYLYQHSMNVCLLSILIAAGYGYSGNQIILIGISALLHDVGMLLVDQDIRFKRGDLDNDKIFEVRNHPALGEMLLLKRKVFPSIVSHVVFQSHEREDGSGYPLGRPSHLIHNFSKIIHVADIYNLLISKRSYQEPLEPYSALQSLLRMARRGLIAKEFVAAFLSADISLCGRKFS